MITILKIKGSKPEVNAIEDALSEYSLDGIKEKNTKVKCHYGNIEGIKNIPLSKSLYTFDRVSDVQLNISFKVNSEQMSFDLDLLGAITNFKPGVIIDVEGYDEESFKYFRFDAYNGLITNVTFLMDERDFCRRIAEVALSLGLHRKDCSSFLLSSSLRLSIMSSSEKRCVLSNTLLREIAIEVRTSSDVFLASMTMFVSTKGELVSLYMNDLLVNFDLDTVRMLT